MHKTFTVIRAFAALALVLALVAGVFAPRGISAQDGSAEPVVETPVESAAPAEESAAPVEESAAPVEESVAPIESTEPEVDPGAVDGDAGAQPGTDNQADGGTNTDIFTVAEDALELRARVQGNNGEGSGQTIYSVGNVGTLESGTSEPLAGATFQVVIAANLAVIDSVTTDANGSALLDVPTNTAFVIVDTENGLSGTSLPLTYTDGDPRPVVTATRIVPAGDVDDDAPIDTIAADQIELRVRSEEGTTDESGTTFIFENGVVDAANDDSQPLAGATFSVVLFDDTAEAPIRIIDTATTDADGVVLLDAPVYTDGNEDTANFYIVDEETNDTSDVFNLTPEDVQAGRTYVTATRIIESEGGTNTGPTGDVLPYPVAADQIELRARYFQDPANDNTTTYIEGPGVGDAASQNGDSIVAAGVTFTVIDDSGRVVDEATTDANGEVLLDVPVNTIGGEDAEAPGTVVFNYFIVNSVDGTQSQAFIAPTADEVQAGRFIVTATISVGDLDEDVPSASSSASGAPSDIAIPSNSASGSGAPSDIAIPSNSASAAASTSAAASASAVASASASASPVYDGEVITDGVTITGLVKVDDERAGTYDYFAQVDEVTTLADEPVSDTRTAFAGEQTYQVYAIVGDDFQLVDSGDTDANGMVVLDIPVDVDYFITEVNDPIGGPTVEGGLETAFVVIEYVATATTSTAPSAAASAGSSAAGSSAPAASAAGTGGTTSTTALPNTGAGSSEMGSSMTWALFALLAVAGVAAAGFGLRRRNV